MTNRTTMADRWRLAWKIAAVAVALAAAGAASAAPQIHTWNGTYLFWNGQAYPNRPIDVVTGTVCAAEGSLGYVTGLTGGKAFNFPGTSPADIACGPGVGTFGTADFSIAFAIKTRQSKGFVAVVNHRPEACGTCNYWAIRLRDGKVFVELDDGQGHYTQAAGAIGVANGAWHTVQVIRSAATTTVYVDGVADVSATASGGVPADLSAQNQILFGFDVCAGVSAAANLVGTLDEITIASK